MHCEFDLGVGIGLHRSDMLPALLWVALSVNPEAAREARELSRHSMTEYDTGKFEQSLKDAVDAFELDPLPAFLYNIAQCHRALHHWEKAEFFYHRYLAHVPKARNRKVVEALIAAVQVRQGKSPDNASQLPDTHPGSAGRWLAGPFLVELGRCRRRRPQRLAPGLMQDIEAYPPVVVVRADDFGAGVASPVRSWAWGTTWVAVGLAVAGAGLGIGNVVTTNGALGDRAPDRGIAGALGLEPARARAGPRHHRRRALHRRRGERHRRPHTVPREPEPRRYRGRIGGPGARRTGPRRQRALLGHDAGSQPRDASPHARGR